MKARRLEGGGVVTPGRGGRAEAFGAALAREGAHPIVFPALAIEDLATSAATEDQLAHLERATLAIFVSAHAVEKGVAAARLRGAWPAALRVAAVGEATAEALRNSGFADVISPPERHDSEGLLALPELAAVRGSRVLIFRGEGGRERLREVLEERGASVAYVECYRRVKPPADPAPLIAAWKRGEIHA